MTTGHRPRCGWGSGDLPAPYCEGDTIDVPEGAKALERMDDLGPGRYRVVGVHSIDEGDAWYIRLGKRCGPCSGRLHLAYAGRFNIAGFPSGTTSVDWLEGCTLVATADPVGLALRERILAAGWTFTAPPTCPTCGQRTYEPRTIGSASLSQPATSGTDIGTPGTTEQPTGRHTAMTTYEVATIGYIARLPEHMREDAAMRLLGRHWRPTTELSEED